MIVRTTLVPVSRRLARAARALTTAAVAVVLHLRDPGAGAGAASIRWRADGAGRGSQVVAARGGGPRVQPLPYEDHTGFQQIFDGQTLKGWDGDPKFWRVENGRYCRREHAREEDRAQHVRHLARRGTQGLRAEGRIQDERDQQRYPVPGSVELKDVGQWVLKGYQADIDFDQPVHRADLRRARTRSSSPLRGQAAYVLADGQPSRVVGTLESGDVLQGADQAERLEPGAHHRARQLDCADRQRPRDERARGRRREEPRAQRLLASRCTSATRCGWSTPNLVKQI